MTKKEVIWREILIQSRKNKINKFTQKGLAEKFGFSISTVFNALSDLRSGRIVNVSGSFFVLEDWGKLVYKWASDRNLKKDIYVSYSVDANIHQIEGHAPPESVFGLYSGFKFVFGYAPSDYDHAYIYLDKEHLPKLIDRMEGFGLEINPSNPNLFVIQPDNWLKDYNSMPEEQLFVDIWNAHEWYSKDFIHALKNKLDI